MLRLLRLLGALALVPLVVFVNPQHAAAATVTPGPWQQVTITVPLPILGDQYGGNGTCKVKFQHAGTHINVGSGGYCLGQGDVTPGWTQPAEAGSSYGLRFAGVDRVSTQGCITRTDGTLGQHEANGTIRVAGSIPSSTAGFVTGEECDITELCITLADSPEGCLPIDLPYPEEETAGSCPAGTPYAFFKIESAPRSEGSFIIVDKLFVEFSVTGNTLGAGRQWGFFAGGIPGTTSHQGPVEPGKIYIDEVSRVSGDPVRTVPASAFIQTYAYVPEPIGQNAYWNEAPRDGKAINTPTTFPITSASPYLGVTDGDQCRWYFGPKRFDDPTSSMDEPFGDAQDPNPPAPEIPVEPVIEQPDPIAPPEGFNWLEAIWVALMSILNALDWADIIQAVTGLADTLLNGLESLFVPSTDEWGVRDIRNQLRDKPPFSIGTEFGEQAQQMGATFKASSGCASIWQSPGINVSCDLPGSVVSLYNLVSFALYSLTGLGMFRMVHGTFQDGS